MEQEAAEQQQEILDANTEEGQDQGMIPKDRLDAEINEKKQLAGQVELLQNQLKLIQANLPGQQQAQAQQQADLATQVLGDLFEEDDTIVSKDQLAQAINRLGGLVNSSISAVSARSKHTDLDEVVTKYLPDVINNNPALTQAIQAAGAHAPLLAYELAKTNPKFAQDKVSSTPEAQAAAQAALRAAKTPGSASSVSSPGSVSKASQIANMTTEQFAAYRERVKQKG